jgi:hypothetical protein
MEAEDVADLEDLPRRARRLGQRAALGRGDAERLFHEARPAGGQAGLNDRLVAIGRRDDIDRIDGG